MRPQAHEIIRTWLFSSVVRAHLENKELPWAHAAISGWILDPDRKKMSKSKGNVVTPMEMLDEYSSDAVRYWAASGRPGTDTAFDVGQMKIGRRLAIKLLNATKFVLTISQGGSIESITEPVDQALMVKLSATVDAATKAFEEFNYAKALDVAETFFWEFTDDYVELVKERAYGEKEGVNTESARSALYISLTTLLRLFAPFLPFTTEETWSWFNSDSVHAQEWPDAIALESDADASVFTDAQTALGLIRKAKSEAKVSMKAEVATASLSGSTEHVERLKLVESDLAAAGNVAGMIFNITNGDVSAEIVLA